MSAAPLLVLDSREAWLPVGVEESCAAAGVKAPPLPDGERLNFPAGMTPPDLPAVLYHRVARAGGLHWHQFWAWWPYNPKNYPPTKRGIGEHEGDWELVQFGCADAQGERPILATYSQHGGAEKREYWRVELANGRPVVYVARDSHAHYFTPERDVTDVADGRGRRLVDVEVRELEPHDWVEWLGRWGNSTNSPGPLTPRRAWRAPHAYHGQARG